MKGGYLAGHSEREAVSTCGDAGRGVQQPFLVHPYGEGFQLVEARGEG